MSLLRPPTYRSLAIGADRRRIIWCPLLAGCLLVGCETPTPIATDLAESGLTLPNQWSSADLPARVNDAWLEHFRQPRLTLLVEEAAAGNFALRAAAERVREARARLRLVDADRRVHVDGSLGASRRGAPGAGGSRRTENNLDARLDLTLELDPWGLLGNETRAASLDAQASFADYAAARLDLAANVARGWFDAVESALQVRLAEETVRNFADNLEVVEAGFRSGLSAALDVRLERANLAGARARLAARRIDDDKALRSLEVLVGRYPSASLVVGTALSIIDGAVPSGLPAELLARRPDVRAAGLRLAASDERLNAALKNRLPRISLSASGGLSSAELRNLLDFDALLWSLVSDLTAPLLRGGALDAERAVAAARDHQALADYAQVVLSALVEVETALTAEGLLVEQEAALRIAEKESTEAEQLALDRYRSGLTDIVTWLEARQRAFDARSSLIAVNNRRLQNRIGLYRALGGDFSSAPVELLPATDGPTRLESSEDLVP